MCRHIAHQMFCLAIALAVLAAQPLGAAAADETPAERQKNLVAVLESPDSPAADKAMACKQLARFADGQAAPALAALLNNEQLAAWARIALEAIPDPAADDALRAAAAQLEGRLLVGVITSIGMRRDSQAVELLAQKLSDSDAAVASAAAIALGRIGNDAATGALTKFLQGPAMAAAALPVRSAVAEGCIMCAEQCLRAGDAAGATRIYDAVAAADVPQQRILEATRGGILARGAGGVARLLALLRSDDPAQFDLGLWVARELPGQEATATLVAELQQMQPERQALLMLALMDRADRPPVSLLVEAVQRGSKPVRITALHAMQQQGDVSCVPALLASVLDADADVAAAAVETIQELPGADIDADLAARLPAAQGPARQSLIEIAGWRGIAAAVPELLKAADDRDASVRTAAYVSLGETIDFARLPWLIERVVKAKNADELASIGDALKAAAGRMPDRDTCANALAAALPQAATPAKCKLLEALGAVGGARALAVIVQASESSDADVRSAAAQQLGDWMTPDAAPALLKMAQGAGDERLKVRALRGYLRVARQFVVPDDQRFEMYKTAMATAVRDEERQLAVEVLIRIPSANTLTEALKYLSQPALRDTAANAAVAIAGKILNDQPKAVADAMQKVIDSGADDAAKARATQLRDQARAKAQ